MMKMRETHTLCLKDVQGLQVKIKKKEVYNNLFEFCFISVKIYKKVFVFTSSKKYIHKLIQ